MNQIQQPPPDQQRFHYAIAGSDDDVANLAGFQLSGFVFQATLEHKSTFNAPRTVLYKRLVALSHELSL